VNEIKVKDILKKLYKNKASPEQDFILILDRFNF